MKLRKHFRTCTSTIDYIITDITFNKITDRKSYLQYCMAERIQKLSNIYNDKIDKILSIIILKYNYDDLPLDSISHIILSLTKVTNALTKGIITLIKE